MIGGHSMRILSLLTLLLSCWQLHASTVLITGANRGLGLEFARQYQAKGDSVIATARKPEQASELKSLGVRVEQLDVTDAKSVSALSQRLQATPIDILINNAGMMSSRSAGLAELDFDQMERVIAVNSIGPMRVTAALLPNLQQGKLKRIVNITSRLGSIELNSGGIYAYRASKTALNQLMRTVSVELASSGFTCVVLHPGWVRTDMGGPRATYSPAESVRKLIDLIDRLDPSVNGRFMDLDGQTIPW